jgi:exo-beta-1,3-glucanase (GH17 family)
MKTIACVVLIMLFTGLFGYLNNLPQAVGADVPEGKLNSLSFAPFREGQGPLEGIFPTSAQIEADLALMAKKTHNIRTYASDEGTMPAIPPLAKKYGLTMIQGAWLGSTHADNQKEIAELIRSANAHPDVVKRVIVGNEVLLRGDLKPEQLVEYIRAVKRAVQQPVSYADVWSEYMKYPQLIKEVDFVTIHILPYWEDEPIAVEQAPAHIERIYKQVQQEADARVHGIPILIGESGWPGAGRQRGRALPSVANEAKFIRAFIKIATDNGFDYNIVEAINQSWKSDLEGVVGANWGLYSVNRQEVFPLTGKVVENPAWDVGVISAMGLFLCVVGIFWKPLQTLAAVPLFSLLAFTQLLLVLWVNQIACLWYTSYSDWQRGQTLLLVGLNALLGGLMVRRMYELFNKQAVSAKLATWLNALYLLIATYAAYKTYCLAINGRYISFPNNVTAIAVAGIIALSLVYVLTSQARALRQCGLNHLLGGATLNDYYHKSLGALLLAAGFLMLIGEAQAFINSRDFIAAYPALAERVRLALLFTLGNGQLVGWLGSIAVLAFPLLANTQKTTT